MNDARNAILEFQQKQITGFQLRRRLINYDKWNVPISEKAAVQMLAATAEPSIQFNMAEDGTKTLLLFTDPESFTEGYVKAGTPAPKQHFVTTKGTWVFQLPLTDFQRILINPGTDASVQYSNVQIDGMRETCEGMIVEDLLAQLRQGKGPEGCVRRVGQYRAYSFAVRKIDGRNVICLAPDTKERKLIAVFTTEDAYDDYIAPLPDEVTSSMFQVKMPGPELFPHLQQHPVDGIVFNCNGPSTPVAFALGLCAVVMQELNSAP